MKRLLIFLYATTILLCMTGCDPGSYSFEYEELTECIVAVELINYDNSEQRHFMTWVIDQSSRLLPFDSNKCTVLASLEEDNLSDFLSDLSEADILPDYYAYNSPKGVCLRLLYENGEFMVIWCNYEKTSYTGYIGTYTSSGEVIDFIGCFSGYFYFEDLVNDYFTFDL